MHVLASSIRLGGGGPSSKHKRQMQTDVSGHEGEIVEAEEGAAYGAALLAGVGAKHWNSVEEACAAAVHVAVRVQPDRAAEQVLKQQYSLYRQLYVALKPLFAQMS